jgi:transposase-like protein
MTKRSFSEEEKISILKDVKRDGDTVSLSKKNIAITLYYKRRD